MEKNLVMESHGKSWNLTLGHGMVLEFYFSRVSGEEVAASHIIDGSNKVFLLLSTYQGGFQTPRIPVDPGK